MERSYLSCAETAKLVRQALKESFPGVKFSVRSEVYAGGASIRVNYTDGPADKLVEQVAKAFEGSYFDGMIDYKGSVYHQVDGKPVRFGADFVFVNRHHTDAMIDKALREVARRFGCPVHSVEDFNMGRLHSVEASLGASRFACSGRGFVQSETNHLLSKLSDRLAAAPSATLARLRPAGDDGYGQGTVGPDPANPTGGSAYRAQAEARERVRILPELAGLKPQGNA